MQRVNTTILRRLEVVNGNAYQVLYTYIGVFCQFMGGWIELLTKVPSHAPPEQGPVQYRVAVKDIEHALVYHLHGIRNKRIRLYKATVIYDGDIEIDNRDTSIHNRIHNINGRAQPLRRGFVVLCNWYICAKVDSYPGHMAYSFNHQ